MKIGILTFHCAHNYGAVLQAYGLQEYLKTLGHETYVIDYRPAYLTRQYPRDGIRLWLSKSPLRTFRKLRHEPFLRKTRACRWDKFDLFINTRLALVPFTRDDTSFDIVFIGSDQVWNPRLTGKRFDDVFFGKAANGRIISYAASSRFKELTENEANYFREKLQNFDAVSVREESLRTLLQPLTDKKIETTIDPTLLAGRDIFNAIAQRPETKTPYVFIYTLDPTQEIHPIALHIARQTGGKVFRLVGRLADSKRIPGVVSVNDLSPEQFLGYIKYATCVVTTSFHGTALSILFQRPFYSIRQGTDADLRAESLLDKLGLTDRFIDKTTFPDFRAINYAPVCARLDEERKASEQFVQHTL